MFEYFNRQKELISGWLERFGAGKPGLLDRVNRFGPQARKKLIAFTRRGKMIRGGLVRIGCELFRDDAPEAVTAVGAALELFQSALLIHDDIMDRDTLRRGRPTLPAEFAAEARAGGLEDPGRAGDSLGICLGDIAFFLAFQILGEAGGRDYPRERLLALFSSELSAVGAAQMLDVWSGAEPPDRRLLSEEEIIALYRFKTGRYTFSLPLAAGALLAGNEAAVGALENIGESLGVIFQIQDDELDLYGDERTIGKPVGSDIREGKNTLLFTRLVPALDAAERKSFFALWGNPALSAADTAAVRRLVEAHGVLAQTRELAASIAARCRKDIDRLEAGRPEKKDILRRLLDYSLSRTA